MTIAAGDRLPSVTFRQMTDEGIKETTSDELFAGKKAVLFAVPGAFTPTCSDQHLPGYVRALDAFSGKGVDLVACTAVNDAFVLHAWASQNGAAEGIAMLADGNGDFAKAVGLELDARGFGLGVRSKRYAMLIEDGVVTSIEIEDNPGAVEVSDAQSMLSAL
ncbi:peroxiredoxin [Marinivivus vitaminiproducens]|uniref:peroxiredoxin n=1 Tax=Marinivivus vitaminiproducens TaxID=3035935 RepID=UPI00279A0907|nr:peroxiredoxin [Geminicoccaceae bacterium SCSIO 64248]